MSTMLFVSPPSTVGPQLPTLLRMSYVWYLPLKMPKSLSRNQKQESDGAAAR